MKDYALPKHKVTTPRKIHWDDVCVLLMLVVGLIIIIALFQPLPPAVTDVGSDSSATYDVKMIDVGDGFVCSPPRGIRREWESAVKQKCKELAAAMYLGRSTQ